MDRILYFDRSKKELIANAGLAICVKMQTIQTYHSLNIGYTQI